MKNTTHILSTSGYALSHMPMLHIEDKYTYARPYAPQRMHILAMAIVDYYVCVCVQVRQCYGKKCCCVAHSRDKCTLA